MNLNLHQLKTIDGPADFLAALVTLSPHHISEENHVTKLNNLCPTQDELATLRDYKAAGKPLDELPKLERCLMAFLQVPRYEARLRTLGYKYTIPYRLARARRVLGVHIAAAWELVTNPMWGSVLRAVRMAGNFMNTGSRLGGVPAFRLRFLSRLADTRSQDGKSNLLGWVVEQVVAQYSAAGGGGGCCPVLRDELPGLSDKDLMSSQQEIDEDVRAAGEAVFDIQRELKIYTPLTDVGGLEDGYPGLMTEVLASLQEAYGEVQAMQARAAAEYGRVLSYYGETSSSVTSDKEFWGPLQAFVHGFSHAQAALVKARAEKEERTARQAKTAAAAAAAHAATPATTTAAAAAGGPAGRRGSKEQPQAGDDAPDTLVATERVKRKLLVHNSSQDTPPAAPRPPPLDTTSTLSPDDDNAAAAPQQPGVGGGGQAQSQPRSPDRRGGDGDPLAAAAAAAAVARTPGRPASTAASAPGSPAVKNLGPQLAQAASLGGGCGGLSAAEIASLVDSVVERCIVAAEVSYLMGDLDDL